MLKALRCSDDTKVYAWAERKDNAPFICPVCRSFVILRQGRIRVSHFAHKPPIICTYGTGESSLHLQCKKAIFDALCQTPTVTDCELERDLTIVRPDVSACIRGEYIAIELQKSNLSIQEIQLRTEKYTSLGISVLWIVLQNPSLGDDKYSPKIWEKWIHAAYLGRVYYWQHSSFVLPIHFDKHFIDVESRTWYDQNGSMQSAGGYTRIARRYKTPKPGPMLNICTDFAGVEHNPWISPTMTLPRRRVYADNLRVWWR